MGTSILMPASEIWKMILEMNLEMVENECFLNHKYIVILWLKIDNLPNNTKKRGTGGAVVSALVY